MSVPDVPSLSRPFVADWLCRLGPGAGGSLTLRLGGAADGAAMVVTAVRAPDRAAWTVSLRAGPHITTLHTDDTTYASAWIVALSQIVPGALLPPTNLEVHVQ